MSTRLLLTILLFLLAPLSVQLSFLHYVFNGCPSDSGHNTIHQPMAIRFLGYV